MSHLLCGITLYKPVKSWGEGEFPFAEKEMAMNVMAQQNTREKCCESEASMEQLGTTQDSKGPNPRDWP